MHMQHHHQHPQHQSSPLPVVIATPLAATPSAASSPSSSASTSPTTLKQLVNHAQLFVADSPKDVAAAKDAAATIWARAGLIDWKFSDFDMSLFAEQPATKWKRFRWAVAVALALNYLWGLVANALVIKSMSASGHAGYVAAYAVLWALELIVFGIDSRTAYHVIQTDDVSDCYQNLEASRWLTIRSFAHYCFITKVSSTFSKGNKVVFWFYKTLRDWKRLVITVIQVSLAIAYWVDSMCYGTITDTCSDNTSDVTFKNASVIFKMATASLAFDAFMLAFVCYPCFRWYVASEVNSVHLSAKMYCSLKFEERLNAVMRDHYRSRNLPPPSSCTPFVNDESSSSNSNNTSTTAPATPLGDGNSGEIHVTVTE